MVRTTKTTPMGSPSKISLHKKVLAKKEELNQDLIINEVADQKKDFRPNQSTGSPSALVKDQGEK